MADDPLRITERSNSNTVDSSCPFCTITSTFTPIPPTDTSHKDWDPDRLSPPTYVLLTTDHVVAFLDIAPLTRGHVLVAPRKHRTKVGDLSSAEAAEVGRVLPLIARATLRAAFPDIPHGEADYNIVQNNGPGAAQVVPHVHFHIIPRPPLDYKPASGTTAIASRSRSKYRPAKIPTGLQASYIQFGRGQRHELDDDDAVDLVRILREHIREEWQKELGTHAAPNRKAQKL